MASSALGRASLCAVRSRAFSSAPRPSQLSLPSLRSVSACAIVPTRSRAPPSLLPRGRFPSGFPLRAYTTGADVPPIPDFKSVTTDFDQLDNSERVVGPSETFGFQAETKKLLDIVARSLYTDKEIFIRELISNASDALEKLRHKRLLGDKHLIDPQVELEISMVVDEATNTFTIQDSGIGMSKEELVENLGTIAHSGSGKFVQSLQQGSSSAQDIIGQFGVGFYSAFMVSDRIQVFSRSAVEGSKGYLWESDGLGSYTIAEAEGLSRGVKIVLHLKKNENAFAKKMAVENIVKKYSNFVNFPIKLNGNTINTVKALWTAPKGSISEEQHKEFYQLIAKAYDEPRYSFHYSTDSPLSIQTILYVPDQHTEKFGLGRMEPGVSLYCRRVLIQAKCKGLLPEWMRFIRGVVDSDDVPLNLSREHLQDSALISRLSAVLTRRVLKFLADEAKADPEKYLSFAKEFQHFLKEGVCADAAHRDDIAKLLRMETSAGRAGEMVSFDDYVGRMKENQMEIYYLTSPSRTFAEQSPYYEGFKKKGLEVLFYYTPVDEYMLSNLPAYKGHKLVCIESADAVPATDDAAEDAKKDETVVRNLNKWIKDCLEDKVSAVRESSRLVNSPALVVDNDSAPMRRLMSKIDPGNAPKVPRQVFEYNLHHPIMHKINLLRFDNEKLAKMCLEQVFDNALVAAGLLQDPRSMLGRLNKVIDTALSASMKGTEHGGVKEAEITDEK